MHRYALTITHNTHHGTANALLCLCLNICNKTDTKKSSELEKLWGQTGELKKLVKDIGLPSRLTDIGINENEIEKLAELAVIGTERSMKNMKIQMRKEEFIQILESAL